ncbi:MULTISPECIES: BadF/BadG/BcrA/BcrD ATPase family protein [Chryseobacterium]|uniref:N-acetylglucosamine kinase-like BadF-type ATPase n=1 Tax=Chryseobacterium geocarposphaerae TaxID=1416776 RepID=A0ABU1LI89_9FLAO|nr:MULTISPECIES: BadF/BadG/BcrA/BcrD ATPase family protein [Chryseobacterium]MDR6406427.1 N-acetylglucosamine kinase-like BadF-type ATPase [Chryseobacterium geocarposphaerae]MDR6699863.1 N-acetylglucosamine kinase-like BadF-type ATPase [Chryseobacterium ginsenosidimutans]
MVAIVDSGSTKSDWVILDEFKKVFLKTETIGFNPNFINKELIVPEIEKNTSLTSVKNSIKKIYFYGSGCGIQKNCDTIVEELSKVFVDAEITVREDLLAAAYAAYQGKPAIVCIMGTGSNSCYFDGENLKIKLPSLGFLMGDEGSGSAIGKQLVRRFFMQKLPADLSREFQEIYNLTIDDALKNMYHTTRPNAYLANFNKFVIDRKDHPYLRDMVLEEMKNFFDYQVLPYEESKEAEINFIGSIAYYYEDILRSAAAELNLNVGQIVQKPIESLVNYHIKYIL